MLQLSASIIPYACNVFTHWYVFYGHLLERLLFYPIGIFLALYVLAAIYYMVRSTAKNFTYHLKTLRYNLIDIIKFLELTQPYLRYFICVHRVLYSIVLDLIMSYSIYRLVFLLKRVEFYFFWLFVILLYC